MPLRDLVRKLYREGVYLSKAHHAIPPHHEAVWWVHGGRDWYGVVTRLSDLFRPEHRWQVEVFPTSDPSRTWEDSVHLSRDVTPAGIADALRQIGVKIDAAE